MFWPFLSNTRGPSVGSIYFLTPTAAYLPLLKAKTTLFFVWKAEWSWLSLTETTRKARLQMKQPLGINPVQICTSLYWPSFSGLIRSEKCLLPSKSAQGQQATNYLSWILPSFLFLITTPCQQFLVQRQLPTKGGIWVSTAGFLEGSPLTVDCAPGQSSLRGC